MNRGAGLRSLRELTLGGVVGSGTFGVVFKAMDGAVPVALKKIKMERETQGFPVTAIREIKILKALRHQNIVNMREIVVYNDETDKDSAGGSSQFVNGDVFMVFEYVDYDLSGILKSSDVNLTPAHIKSFAKQLLEGVHYLHKNKILHRDIKAANILITKDNVLKIADWGLARFYQKGNTRMTNPVVTLWYRSPELLCGSREYGPEVDIWSVGCLFAEMYTRNPIFVVKDSPDSHIQQLHQLCEQCGYPLGELLEKYKRYPDWDKCKPGTVSNNRIRHRFPLWTEKALNLLEKFLDFDPDKRITADSALNDEYFYDGEEVKRAEDLPRFGTVETARGMDVAVKQKADYEQAVEAARAAEEKKRREEQALVASLKAEKRQKNRQGGGGGSYTRRHGAGLGGGASKYKVVRPGDSGAGARAPSPATAIPAAAAAASTAPATTSHNVAATAGAHPQAPATASTASKKEPAAVPAVPTLVVSSEAKAGGGTGNGAPAVVNTINVASISNDSNKGGGW